MDNNQNTISQLNCLNTYKPQNAYRYIAPPLVGKYSMRELVAICERFDRERKEW